MNTFAVSGFFVLIVCALAVWAAVSANRAPAPGKLAVIRYPGINMDTFVSAWTRKFWRDPHPARSAPKSEQAA